MLKISRESEINLINVLIDHDIISGKDLPNIKKVSTEKNSSQIDAVFELKLTDENKILDVLVKEQNLDVVDLTKCEINDIQVNTLEEAYLYGIEILNGKRGPGFDMVALNAGSALYISNQTQTLSEGVEKAKRELHSGRPLLLLNRYAKFTNQT